MLGVALIWILEPLLLPIITGLFDTTLIRYPLPDEVSRGIVALIVPLDVLVVVPITVGLEKSPLELDNSAVKTLPGL
jgi:hypothetical protein